MTIPPFLAGVIVTLVCEVIVINIIAIVGALSDHRRENRREVHKDE